jgi:MFS family permease
LSTRLWTKDFIFVCATNLFLMLNYYYLLVTLPIFLIQEMDGPASQIGLVITVFYISAILIRPFAGQWTMKYGIKNIFFIALALYLISSFMYFFTTTLSSLLILRFIHGIAFGMFTTAAGTIAANIIPDSKKGEGMGYYGLMMNISMALGPFLGLFAMYNWGTTVMFAFSVVSTVIGTVAGLLISLPKKVIKAETPVKKGFDFKSTFETSSVKISFVALFFGFIYSSITSFVSVYAEEINLSHIASYFFIVYAIVLVLSRPLTGRWFDQYGANYIMYPAILLFAAGLYFLSSADSAFVFLLAAALVGLGWGTIFPSAQTIAIQVAPPERRGVATATFLSFLDTGIAIGSLIVGFVGAGIGYGSLYFYCSLITVLGLAVYYLMHGKGSKEARSPLSEEKTV